MLILKVTEVTLRDWIQKGIAKPKKHSIGKRFFYEFSDDEIERLRTLKRKGWKQGQPKLR